MDAKRRPKPSALFRIAAPSAIACAALVATALALPSHAAREARTIDPMMVPTNTVHSGAHSYDDHELVSQIVAALNGDTSLNGSAITVVAKDGRVTLSGSAKDLAQAARAERLARDIAGARAVGGKLDVQGG
jgi:osmotically-inducible protein OsmY